MGRRMQDGVVKMRRKQSRRCFVEERCTGQCAYRKMEEEEMPCEGEVGNGGGLVGVFLPLCACASAIGGVARAEPWERCVPELQMAWHSCQGYDWHSLYCTTNTVLPFIYQPSELPHS